MNEPINARLLAAAKAMRGQVCRQGAPLDEAGIATWGEFLAAIAEAERATPQWTRERPTVPGWYFMGWFSQGRWVEKPARIEPSEYVESLIVGPIWYCPITPPPAPSPHRPPPGDARGGS